MGQVFRNLAGTTKRTFSLGSPLAPEATLGHYAYASLATPASTTSTSYVTYLTLDVPSIPTGIIYLIEFSFLWNIAATNREFSAQLTLDGTQLWYNSSRCAVSAERRDSSGARTYNFATETTHTILLRYRTSNAGVAATIYQAAISIRGVK